MVEKIITKLLHKRHYWRYVEFSELAELYASRVLRTMALSLVSVFVAVYLYQNGYSLTFISGYFAVLYATRGILAVPSAYVIGRIGPKHATLISNMTYVPAMISLSSLDSNGTTALVFTLVFQAISASLYNIAYLVDFSKVKHHLHAGKEIGYMIALERTAMAISPIVGGFTAYMFGPQATIILAAVLFGLAAWPLLLTAEPIRTHQHVTFKDLKWPKIERSLIAEGGIGWDFVSSGIIWSLFVSITVFGTGNDSIYAKMGIVSAVSVIASVLTSRLYGILIDQKRGNDLLHFGVFGSSILNLTRPLVTTALGVVLTNVTNEATKTAYNMPFTKGVFDLADDLDKHRIAFIACLDMAVSAGGALALISLCYLSTVYADATAIKILFSLSAVMVLLIGTHRLKALKPRY
jgi:Major Facilitator Superfamily